MKIDNWGYHINEVGINLIRANAMLYKLSEYVAFLIHIGT